MTIEAYKAFQLIMRCLIWIAVRMTGNGIATETDLQNIMDDYETFTNPPTNYGTDDEEDYI